jgi:hypothetical protein
MALSGKRLTTPDGARLATISTLAARYFRLATVPTLAVRYFRFATVPTLAAR